MRSALILCSVLFISTASDSVIDKPIERHDMLSEYQFFIGDIAELKPSGEVIPYAVNTPLFSNYSEKLRFMKLPPDGKASFRDSTAFEFPVGTILIKNFFYPLDFRTANGPRRIIETRLLVHQPGGWDAWPYIWNDEQTEAFYDPAGETKTVRYIAGNGKQREITYAVPNKNQCKGCHIRNDKLLPVGLTARQLNGEYPYPEGRRNQLEYWTKHELLHGLPDLSTVPALPVWDDPDTGSLDQRARAYLDANCGHCHSATGPANTSGLFLDFFETSSIHLGVNKTPVAAGRGAGKLKYDIVPGKPDQSILVFRMKTNDPAIAMPEIGREQVHAEGVALIEEWIRKGDFK